MKNEGADNSNDYCGFEKFVAKCPRDEIILIRKAEYGRMQAGRCITAEYDHAIGCSADVTGHVGSVCSGRGNCSILVATMDSIAQPCPKDFKSYLRASYTCVKVSFTDDCNQHSNSTQLSDSLGYLALFPRSIWIGGSDSIRGKRSCYWSFKVEPGRRIELYWAKTFSGAPTLTHTSDSDPLNRDNLDGRPGSGTGCPIHLHLSESGPRSDVLLNSCYTDIRQGEPLYRSHTHQLTVSVVFSAQPVESWNSTMWRRQILRYSVTGCIDLEEIVEGAVTVLRHSTSATVRCNETGDRWDLYCAPSGKWVGELGNCSSETAPKLPVSATVSYSGIDVKNGAMWAVLVGVAVGMLIGSLLLFTIILVKRSYGLWAPERCTAGPYCSNTMYGSTMLRSPPPSLTPNPSQISTDCGKQYLHDATFYKDCHAQSYNSLMQEQNKFNGNSLMPGFIRCSRVAEASMGVPGTHGTPVVRVIRYNPDISPCAHRIHQGLPPGIHPGSESTSSGPTPAMTPRCPDPPGTRGGSRDQPEDAAGTTRLPGSLPGYNPGEDFPLLDPSETVLNTNNYSVNDQSYQLQNDRTCHLDTTFKCDELRNKDSKKDSRCGKQLIESMRWEDGSTYCSCTGAPDLL